MKTGHVLAGYLLAAGWMVQAAAPAGAPGPVSFSGARGETASGQAAFPIEQEAPEARATVTDLRHRESGAVIPAAAVRLQWVRYLAIGHLYGLDGYLRWGLNQSCGDDPYSEAGVSQDLPLGDRAIAYPGRTNLLGSLRFSAQRDGLQDFEYVRLAPTQARQFFADDPLRPRLGTLPPQVSGTEEVGELG